MKIINEIIITKLKKQKSYNFQKIIKIIDIWSKKTDENYPNQLLYL